MTKAGCDVADVGGIARDIDNNRPMWNKSSDFNE
jgi:hypothetical protein